MTSTRALRILLALALLAVWQAALLHPLQHVDAKGAFVHVPGSHLPKSPGDQSGSNLSCDTIAAVATCIGGSLVAAIATGAGFDAIPVAERRSAMLAPRRACLGQAPPAVL